MADVEMRSFKLNRPLTQKQRVAIAVSAILLVATLVALVVWRHQHRQRSFESFQENVQNASSIDFMYGYGTDVEEKIKALTDEQVQQFVSIVENLESGISFRRAHGVSNVALVVNWDDSSAVIRVQGIGGGWYDFPGTVIYSYALDDLLAELREGTPLD